MIVIVMRGVESFCGLLHFLSFQRARLPLTMEGEEPDNIWIAISNGDMARVQHLVVQEGVSVNVQDDQGYSPM